MISTHTPHAGRDMVMEDAFKSELISTHTPHAGRDFTTGFRKWTIKIFLLTRPMRGVTSMMQISDDFQDISTHTPHAGRDSNILWVYLIALISTHTPHAGRDIVTICASVPPDHFYSHAPCGA